jgi:hypothetical protein
MEGKGKPEGKTQSSILDSENIWFKSRAERG